MIKKILPIIIVIGMIALTVIYKYNDNSDLTFVIYDSNPGSSRMCALEEFYDDGNYIYSWPYIQDGAMIVEYSNGKTELVSHALKWRHIKISDLDKFDIKYCKSEKNKN